MTYRHPLITVISKLLELVLMELVGDKLTSFCLQEVGFKSKSSLEVQHQALCTGWPKK